MNVCVCVKGVEKENIVQYIFFWRFFFSTPGEWQISVYVNVVMLIWQQRDIINTVSHEAAGPAPLASPPVNLLLLHEALTGIILLAIIKICFDYFWLFTYFLVRSKPVTVVTMATSLQKTVTNVLSKSLFSLSERIKF